MNFLATIKLVLRGLIARKGRSVLTILGIVIGVAGVIIIIALGAGAQSLVLGQVTKLGTNLLNVQPGKSSETGPPAQVFGVIVTTLKEGDADALRDKVQAPHLTVVNAVAQGRVAVAWENRSVDTNMIATDADYNQLVSFDMQAGRFFTPTEEEGGTAVAVLGSVVSDALFKDAGVDPIGQVIKVKSAAQTEAGGVPLRVVGVIEPRGSAFFQDQDDQIFLPLAIGQQRVLGKNYLNAILAKVDDAANIQSSIADIKRILRREHRILGDEQEEDFTVRNQAEAVKILSSITDALSLFLTAMAAIALTGGGGGILNIMLVAVAERTRVIGLRKAVGATNRAVLTQFLYESSFLTLMGGIVGIIAGIVLAYLIALLMRQLGYDWAFVISPLSILMAVGVSVLTGVLFGLYPALKASRLNPIQALHYE